MLRVRFTGGFCFVTKDSSTSYALINMEPDKSDHNETWLVEFYSKLKRVPTWYVYFFN